MISVYELLMSTIIPTYIKGINISAFTQMQIIKTFIGWVLSQMKHSQTSCQSNCIEHSEAHSGAAVSARRSSFVAGLHFSYSFISTCSLKRKKPEQNKRKIKKVSERQRERKLNITRQMETKRARETWRSQKWERFRTGVGGKLRLRQQMDRTKEKRRSGERGRKVNPPTVCGGDARF